MKFQLIVITSLLLGCIRAQQPNVCDSGLPVADGVCSSGDEIPGVAGVDYPIYSSVPRTNFDCNQLGIPGYYADPESGCQAFYICQNQGKGRGFLCPNGTLFNQEVLVCDWWTNVDCSKAVSQYDVNLKIQAEMEAANERLGVNQRERERLANAGLDDRFNNQINRYSNPSLSNRFNNPYNNRFPLNNQVNNLNQPFSSTIRPFTSTSIPFTSQPYNKNFPFNQPSNAFNQRNPYQPQQYRPYSPQTFLSQNLPTVPTIAENPNQQQGGINSQQYRPSNPYSPNRNPPNSLNNQNQPSYNPYNPQLSNNKNQQPSLSATTPNPFNPQQPTNISPQFNPSSPNQPSYNPYNPQLSNNQNQQPSLSATTPNPFSPQQPSNISPQFNPSNQNQILSTPKPVFPQSSFNNNPYDQRIGVNQPISTISPSPQQYQTSPTSSPPVTTTFGRFPSVSSQIPSTTPEYDDAPLNGANGNSNVPNSAAEQVTSQGYDYNRGGYQYNKPNREYLPPL